MSCVALVSVAVVAFVRKDVHDHAIWTVVFVSHPVVTDHYHRHSLEFDSVECPVLEIVVVIAHAVHFRVLLLLSHQLVEELGAILVVVHVNLAVQDALEVCQDVHSRGSNVVLKKSNSPIGLERVFQRSTQAVDSPQRNQNRNRGCPEATHSTGNALSAKK